MDKFLDILKKNKNYLIPIGGLLIYCLLGWFLNIPCSIKFLTGVSCLGCGMSRAAVALLSLDFVQAWYYHPGIFILIPFVVAIVMLDYYKKTRLRKILILILCFAFVAIYLYRALIQKSPVLIFDVKEGFVFKFYSSIIEFFRNAIL